ncbi:helix-turn-helix transcriptional regulator [Catellatospora sp. NPDC049111]|uniref:helix-turn-helix domain-containing protein n=1 Tax=Catellatospora sp. NPDC049111 TaxID=3155271 RepID=UPI0033F1224C
MAGRLKELRPELSALHLFGARLRTLREATGLSQTELGRRVSYSGHLIGKIELGLRRPAAELVRALDRELRTDGSLSQLALELDREDAEAQLDATDVPDLLTALRRCLDLRDDPDDGLIRDVSDLELDVAEIVRKRLASDYRGLACTLPLLLPELHRANVVMPGPVISALLFQVYRAADAIADKSGQHDLSARLIDLLRASAAGSDEPLTMAAAEYVRGELFFVNRDFLRGEKLLDQAAARIEGVARNSPAAGAQVGSLHMRAAVLAARGGDRAAAEGHLQVAARWADRVRDGVYRGTAFGISSVRIHQVSLALDVDDLVTALELSGNWVPPSEVPAERRSHFFLDRAVACQRAGRHDEAVAALTQARRIAPQHMRPHPQVKAVLAGLVAEARRPSDRLTNLCRWAGRNLS